MHTLMHIYTHTYFTHISVIETKKVKKETYVYSKIKVPKLYPHFGLISHTKAYFHLLKAKGWLTIASSFL